MTDPKESSVSFIRQESRTEFDAVHPRFRIPPDPEEILQLQMDNDYYCNQCQLFFAPTLLGLQTHFDRPVVEHSSVGSCIYCKGVVYCYKFREKEELYHNCLRSNTTKR